MLLTYHPTQRHTPGTLHPGTLRALPYTYYRCSQRIPTTYPYTDATNVCLQRMPVTYPYTDTTNVCLRRIPMTIQPTYPYNVSPTIYLQYISPPHIPTTLSGNYGKLWFILVKHGEVW